MKKIIIAILMFAAVSVRAQSPQINPNDLAALGQWITSQQVNFGAAKDLHAKSAAVGWWDVISIGRNGFNVAKASDLDCIDFGAGSSVMGNEKPRYGVMVPIHFGNLWNTASSRLPTNLASHVYLPMIPKVTIAPLFLQHKGNPKKWNWNDDFEMAVSYSFGGI